MACILLWNSVMRVHNLQAYSVCVCEVIYGYQYHLLFLLLSVTAGEKIGVLKKKYHPVRTKTLILLQKITQLASDFFLLL